MVVMTPSTIMPPPTCDKKIAISEKPRNTQSRNHKTIYSQAIIGNYQTKIISMQILLVR